jgi:dihydrosphingosine 1-phosphate phosphatase
MQVNVLEKPSADLCSLVDLLAPGVFFTGMIKDFLCLPRPLSPPLQRITMSGLTALEYGFPSTHSTNAVSVALYGLTLLETSNLEISDVTKIVLQGIAALYASSVVMGRIYCGMHGFLGMSTEK